MVLIALDLKVFGIDGFPLALWKNYKAKRFSEKSASWSNPLLGSVAWERCYSECKEFQEAL
jgi:hypothetical protein